MLQGVRKAVADSSSRRSRLDRAYFAYVGGKARLRWQGLSLDPVATDDDRGAVRDALAKEIARADADALADVKIAGDKEGVKNLVELQTPGSPLVAVRSRIVAEQLDGVGVTDVYFDAESSAVVSGIWNGDYQKGSTYKLVKKVLVERKVLADADPFRVLFKPVPSNEVLLALRKWTADNLEEAFVRRLFYNLEGVLTIEGDVTSLADRRRCASKLDDLLIDHESFQRRFTVPRLAALAKLAEPPPLQYVVAPPPPQNPSVKLEVKLAAVPLLRERCQMGAGARAALKPAVWDGLALVRGYFATSGAFVLTGLTDGPRQKRELLELIEQLKDEQPYKRAFGGDYVVDLREDPLAPTLRRLAQAIPAYERLDGLKLHGASHDVHNRFVLRVSIVGRRTTVAIATPILLDLLKTDKRSLPRVHAGDLRINELDNSGADPLRLLVFRPTVAADFDLAAKNVKEAIEVLSRAYVDTDDHPCRKMAPAQAREYRLKLVAEALVLIDVARLHNPSDVTAWYLWGVCHVATGETILARRDLRRMIVAERTSRDRTVSTTRVELLEHLQGDFRRVLAKIRKRAEADEDTAVPRLRPADLP
jgi:hypothetical protein